MKLITYAVFLSLLLISCKKNDEDNPGNHEPPPVADSLYPTGLIRATPEELATVKSIRTVDTSMVREFGRPMDMPVLLSGLPDAKEQEFGSCQSWALGYYIMSYYYRTIEKYPDLLLSPTFIYNQTALNQNEGVSCVEALDFTKKNGTCTWSYMNGTPTKFTDKPTPEATKNALNFTIGDYFRFDHQDFPMIKTYLRRKMPILIDFDLDLAWQLDGYKNNSDYIVGSDGSFLWKSINNYKKPTKDSVHAVIVCGYSNDKNAFLIKNSWGIGWGQNGYMWIDYAVFEKVVAVAFLAVPRFVKTEHVDDGLINVEAKGNVTNYGFFQIKTKGFCYSTDTLPTLADPNDLEVDIATSAEGDFKLPLRGLKANTTYYVRAYVTSNTQTYYGIEESFTTGTATEPTLTTKVPSQISNTSAQSGGNITSDGGDPITSKGVCWSLSRLPTTNDSKTTNGGGIETFISGISGLTPKTTYFVRAFATNSLGTGYGNEESFTTSDSVLLHFEGQSLYSGESTIKISGGPTFTVSSTTLVTDFKMLPGTYDIEITRGGNASYVHCSIELANCHPCFLINVDLNFPETTFKDKLVVP